jgi:hypothetical protein
LYGQPFRGGTARDDQVHAAIPELRRVLAYVDVGPELEGPPRSLDELAAEVATAGRLRHQGRLAQLGAHLPSMLEELTYWAYDTDAPRAWALLHKAHNAAAGFTRRLGYGGDSLALLDRAAEAARRSQDPHLPLLVTLPRSLLLMAMNQNRSALKLLDMAVAGVQPGLRDADEIAGAIHLRRAIIAARALDPGRAWDYFGQAVQLIKTGRARTDDHGLQFNPANVAIHGAAVAVELGDLDDAARRDHEISDRIISGLVPERRAHHQIDMSRVHVETGDYGKALERLLAAEQTAPQLTRFHPSARAVVAHLVDVRRTLPEPLRRLHTRMSA